MATIKIGAPTAGASKNKRFKVSYTMNGKKVTSAGMLFGGKNPEQSAAAYVARTLSNLGLTPPTEFDVVAADAR